MQKKWLRMVAVLLMMSFILSGCAILGFGGGDSAAPDLSTYERIHNSLMNMQTFRAEATVKYISNRNTNEYTTIQQARITGEYRIEVTGPADVAGNITMFDGSTIYQLNPAVSDQIAVGTRETPERSEILLTSFIRNYRASQEVTLAVSDFGEGRATIFEAPISGTHPYMATGRLWVDNETLNPLQLIIFDPEGIERIVVTYIAFEYNVELPDSLFAPVHS